MLPPGAGQNVKEDLPFCVPAPTCISPAARTTHFALVYCIRSSSFRVIRGKKATHLISWTGPRNFHSASGCVAQPWHHTELNYYLAAGFQIRNLKWPKFDLCCLAEASSGNWTWCHPKVPLVNGPGDAGQPWLLGPRQSANTSLSLSFLCVRSCNKGSTLSYSLAQEHLMDSRWPTTHSPVICLSATQTSTAPKFQKWHFSIDLVKNFPLKALFQEKMDFYPKYTFSYIHLPQKTLMPVRKRSAWKAKCAVCSLIFNIEAFSVQLILLSAHLCHRQQKNKLKLLTELLTDS